MIGVDTNVLARFVLAGDAGQHRRAVAALETDEDLFIPVTVLLELAWVLGARDATRAEITLALSERTDKFLSFDAILARRAGRLGARPAVSAA